MVMVAEAMAAAMVVIVEAAIVVAAMVVVIVEAAMAAVMVVVIVEAVMVVATAAVAIRNLINLLEQKVGKTEVMETLLKTLSLKVAGAGEKGEFQVTATLQVKKISTPFLQVS